MKYVTAMARYTAFVVLLTAINPDASTWAFILLGVSAALGWSSNWDTR